MTSNRRFCFYKPIFGNIFPKWKTKLQCIFCNSMIVLVFGIAKITCVNIVEIALGLNSDASAKAQGKGPNRPINDENSRATVLAGLASVDLIVKFNDPTPLSLIETILPNVLVKGGDYSLDQIVGAEIVTGNGGVVKSIPFVEGYSTTSIEQKILKGVKAL